MTTKRRSFLPAFLKALPALAKTFPAHPAHFLPPHPGYFNWGKWFPDAIYKVLLQTRGRARAKWKSGQNPGMERRAQGSSSASAAPGKRGVPPSSGSLAGLWNKMPTCVTDRGTPLPRTKAD